MSRCPNLWMATLAIGSIWACNAGESAARAGELAPISIPNEVTCPQCDISIELVAQLSGRRDKLARMPLDVRADSRGRFWISDEKDATSVYAANGQYVEDVGRIGSGPGEFAAGAQVVPMGDSIVVIDHWGGRMAVLSPDLRVVQTVPLPDQIAPMVWLRGRTLVGSSLMHTPPHVGWQLHLFTATAPTAHVTRSFGLGDGRYTYPSPSAPYNWNLAAAGSGGFWSADAVRYRLAQWTIDGALERVFERAAKWFPAVVSITA